MSNEPLLTLTKKDFKVTTFRASGAGGQHRNKTDSAVRIVHPESGAVGQCTNYRSQHQNKEEAFKRLVNSPTFKMWHRRKCAELMRGKTVEEVVEEQMTPSNLKIETKQNGKWKEEKVNEESR